MVERTPSMFAGHSMLCPYESKAKSFLRNPSKTRTAPFVSVTQGREAQRAQRRPPKRDSPTKHPGRIPSSAADRAKSTDRIVCATKATADPSHRSKCKRVRDDSVEEKGSRCELEAGGAAGGGAGFGRGSNAQFRGCACLSRAEAQPVEVGLAEGHHAGVEVAPDEEKKEGNRGVVFVLNGVADGGGEVKSEQDFRER